MLRVHFLVLSTLAVAATACAGQGPPSNPPEGGTASGQGSRTLVAAIRDEPGNIALNPFSQPGQATYLIKRVFNAQLSNVDNEAVAHPYLAEALPRLNSDTWRILPDGRMETTWRLKPDLFWHNGTALSAEDFAFSWRVYSTPELGNAGGPPFVHLEDVTAPDDRTIVFHWKRIFPGAATMYEHNREFPALPRHIIGAPFQQNTPDAFINLPYWTHEYVGLGPYRLERWEAGQFLEASAFDRHATGRPKIPRIRLMFIADDNTVLASLLAGEIHLTGDAGARLSQVPLLKQDWVPSGVGAVHLHFNQWRAVYIQFRPEFLEQRALLDRRVRAALFHALDRQAVTDSVYGGEAPLGDFLLPPLGDLGRAADRAAAKYPYDPRRSEQLMVEAGYAHASDGVFAGPAGRVGFEVLTQAASDNNAEIAIIADGWKQAGFAAEQRLLSGPAARAPDVLAVFPGALINSTSASLGLINDFRNTSIPTRDNRWNGSNRGGWNHADYTALAEAFASTLDPEQRLDQVGRPWDGKTPSRPR